MWSNVDTDKNLKNLLETFKIKDIDSYFKPDLWMLWLQESQNISWQPIWKSLIKDIGTTTWDQTMDFSNQVAGTSINLPV
jgi:hypothetical protein